MTLDIKFDWTVFISFIVGIIVGLVFAVLVYLIISLSSFRKNKHIIKPKNTVSDKDINLLIESARLQFKSKELKGEQNTFAYCYDLSKNLIIDIAKKYYPNSKHPLTEISVDELLELTRYISNRVDELLSKRGLKILRKIKVSTLLSIYDTKEFIDENALVKSTKKYKIGQALGAAKKVLNIVNPVWWTKKFVASKALDIVINKLCLVIISVVGEETNNIYSKSIYDSAVDVDSGVGELVDDIDKTIEENEDEEMKALEEENNDVLLIENNKTALPEKKKKKFHLFRRKNKEEI